MGNALARLGGIAAEELEVPAEAGGILVPAMAVWELAMLEARGRLSLARPVGDWVEAALGALGTAYLDLAPAVAVESTRLPGSPPSDPADRMMIASARVTGARLATADAAILRYAEGGAVRVLDARE
jgi:PIN domain nuclease of toxin-antitoxin system